MWFQVASCSNYDRGKSAVHCPGGPWCDTCSFNGAVERSVEVSEALVMQPVPRLVDVQQSDNEPRLLGLTADAARGLNVLGGCLRLTLDKHEAKPADVEADRDHISSERDVDAVL